MKEEREKKKNQLDSLFIQTYDKHHVHTAHLIFRVKKRLKEMPITQFLKNVCDNISNIDTIFRVWAQFTSLYTTLCHTQFRHATIRRMKESEK